MSIDVSPFRVKEAHKVNLKTWPTRVRPLYDSGGPGAPVL